MGVRACAFFPKNCWQTAPEVLSSFTFVGSSCPTCLFKEAATGDKIEEPSHTGFDISWGTGEGSMVAHISLHTKSVGKTKLRRDDDDEDEDEDEDMMMMMMTMMMMMMMMMMLVVVVMPVMILTMMNDYEWFMVKVYDEYGFEWWGDGQITILLDD